MQKIKFFIISLALTNYVINTMEPANEPTALRKKLIKYLQTNDVGKIIITLHNYEEMHGPESFKKLIRKQRPDINQLRLEQDFSDELEERIVDAKLTLIHHKVKKKWKEFENLLSPRLEQTTLDENTNETHEIEQVKRALNHKNSELADNARLSWWFPGCIGTLSGLCSGFITKWLTGEDHLSFSAIQGALGGLLSENSFVIRLSGQTIAALLLGKKDTTVRENVGSTKALASLGTMLINEAGSYLSRRNRLNATIRNNIRKDCNLKLTQLKSNINHIANQLYTKFVSERNTEAILSIQAWEESEDGQCEKGNEFWQHTKQEEKQNAWISATLDQIKKTNKEKSGEISWTDTKKQTIKTAKQIIATNAIKKLRNKKITNQAEQIVRCKLNIGDQDQLPSQEIETTKIDLLRKALENEQLRRPYLENLEEEEEEGEIET